MGFFNFTHFLAIKHKSGNNTSESKPYTYDKHLVPHDAAVKKYSTGLSRVEVARNHAIEFTVVSDIGVNKGINAGRNLLNRCWFDETKYAKGITALES